MSLWHCLFLKKKKYNLIKKQLLVDLDKYGKKVVQRETFKILQAWTPQKATINPTKETHWYKTRTD